MRATPRRAASVGRPVAVPLTATLLALSLFATPASAADWAHWRGPNRNGITDEPSGWDGQRPWPGPPVWKKEFGTGSTSPVVVGDRLYVPGWGGGKDYLTCADAATGQTLWQQSYDSPERGRHATGDEGLYAGPTATPEYDPATGLLYTLSVDGLLACWDTRQDGRQTWTLNLYDAFGVGRRPKVGRQGLRDYGYTTSPLVHRDWLLVEVGDDEGTVMAFDKRTGRRLWASQYNRPAGHTGGLVPMKVEGVPCAAVLCLYDLLVLRLDEGSAGKTVGTYEWTTDFANNIATPAADGDALLITSGYNHETACKLEVTLGGVRKAWETPGQYSLICSPVIHGGRAYWAWQELRCLDWSTGEPKWSGGKWGDAGSCVLTADGKLLVWGGNGLLALVETDGPANSPGAYKELARVGPLFDTDVWPHLVLSGGRLFCKDRLGRLQCFQPAGAAANR